MGTAIPIIPELNKLFPSVSSPTTAARKSPILNGTAQVPILKATVDPMTKQTASLNMHNGTKAPSQVQHPGMLLPQQHFVYLSVHCFF